MGMFASLKNSLVSTGVTIRHAKEQRRRWRASEAELSARLAHLVASGASIDEQAKVNNELLVAGKAARMWRASTSPSLTMALVGLPVGLTAALAGLAAAFGPGFAFRELSDLSIPASGYGAFAAFVFGAWLLRRFWDRAPKGVEQADLQFAGHRRAKGLLLGVALGILAPAAYGAFRVVDSLPVAGLYGETGFARGADGKVSDLHVGLKYKAECSVAASRMNEAPAGFAPGSFLASNFVDDARGLAAMKSLRARRPALDAFSMEFTTPAEPVLLVDFRKGRLAAIEGRDLVGLGGRWIARVDGKQIAAGDTYCGASSTQRRAIVARFSDDPAFLDRMSALSANARDAKRRGDEPGYAAASRAVMEMAVSAVLAEGH